MKAAGGGEKVGKGGGSVQIVAQRGAFLQVFGQARKSSSVSLDHSFFFFCFFAPCWRPNPIFNMIENAERINCV